MVVDSVVGVHLPAIERVVLVGPEMHGLRGVNLIVGRDVVKVDGVLAEKALIVECGHVAGERSVDISLLRLFKQIDVVVD